jgi:putative YhdH/YhfP family quinone oxidoreductase
MKAFRIEEGAAGQIVDLDTSALSAGEVTLQVSWSSVNYKDALAGSGRGKILRNYPLNGGIDVAGTVTESRDERFREGDQVLVTGCGLSETRDGGYSEYLRVPAQWTIALPAGLSAREAMGLGTAGFTAALSLKRMQDNGQRPDMGPIVVTGATGGVGMLALDLFSTAGYEVHAISGKPEKFDFLIELGARQCISRANLHWGQRPLEAATWAGAVDNVGGDMLAGLSRVIKPYGNIASCGLTQSAELHTTVMPFIIRGVSMLGIASAGSDYATRVELWQRLASDWKPAHLDRVITREVSMEGLPEVFDSMLAGGAFGRTVVRIGS